MPLKYPETDRVLLREFKEQDALAISKIMSPAVSKWLASWPPDVTEQQALKVLVSYIEKTKKKQCLALAITRKEDDQLLGTLIVKVAKSNRSLGELGYWIGEAYQGKGYLGEVIKSFANYAMEHLNLTTLQAGAQIENKVSFALMEKVDMTIRGTESVYVPSRERHEEVLYYTLQKP